MATIKWGVMAYAGAMNKLNTLVYLAKSPEYLYRSGLGGLDNGSLADLGSGT